MAALSDTKIKNAKPGSKPYKLYDAAGLFVLVQPNGSKLWRFKYKRNGKEQLLSLGKYPFVSLAEARERRDAQRKLLEHKQDPSEARKAEKAARLETLNAAVEEWLTKNPKKLAPVTLEKARWQFGFVTKELGNKPVSQISPADLLRVLSKLEDEGLHETAHRIRARMGQLYRWLIPQGAVKHDITFDLRGALSTIQVEHRAAITDPRKVAELLRALDDYGGQPSVSYALRLGVMLFARPGELRAAEWTEFDLDSAEPTWRIPASKMKMKDEHLVPLPQQAVALLRELRGITGYSVYLFPSLRSKERCISENTLNAALRRIGYAKHEQTAHGFRTIASTLLNERGVDPDLIELQLAHKPRNKVRAAYNRAERLAERRAMMQQWADYLDELKRGDSQQAQCLCKYDSRTRYEHPRCPVHVLPFEERMRRRAFETA